MALIDIERQERPTVQMPRLGEPAPHFDGHTTQGRKTLVDYRGRWLVLFSHPADFTPVCSSEIVAFARAQSRFKALGCELLGLSTDSLYSHIAWLRSLEAEQHVSIGFPILDDSMHRIATAYGMIHPGAADAATVRALFVIDPDSILRAQITYPQEVGRSVAEVVRLVQALQSADRHRVVCPEAWQPGEPAFLPPPTTTMQAASRAEQNPLWYQVPKAL